MIEISGNANIVVHGDVVNGDKYVGMFNADLLEFDDTVPVECIIKAAFDLGYSAVVYKGVTYVISNTLIAQSG